MARRWREDGEKMARRWREDHADTTDPPWEFSPELAVLGNQIPWESNSSKWPKCAILGVDVFPWEFVISLGNPVFCRVVEIPKESKNHEKTPKEAPRHYTPYMYYCQAMQTGRHGQAGKRAGGQTATFTR